jgi:hypothetical protein
MPSTRDPPAERCGGLVDGYPFEVPKPEEIFDFLRDKGFTLHRIGALVVTSSYSPPPAGPGSDRHRASQHRALRRIDREPLYEEPPAGVEHEHLLRLVRQEFVDRRGGSWASATAVVIA